MKILILSDEKTVFAKLSELVIAAVKAKPDLVLGLSPCSQVVPCYQGLIDARHRKEVSFHGVRFFSTDEFVGLGPDNHLSNAFLLWNTLFYNLDLERENVFLLDGTTANPVAECAEYERKITQAGGIDLQIVSLGLHGEVGRNEPTSSLGSRCRVKTLTPGEADRNGRFVGREHPRFGMTIGIATMMAAKEAILVAVGSGRAMPLSKAVEGPLTSSVTASIFQRHQKLTVLLDEPAATFLKRKDYYKSTM